MISNKIPEISCIDAEKFHTEIVNNNKPVVIRGLVAHWLLVQAAQKSDVEFCNYIKKFDRGYDLDTMTGPSSINGRIFYNQDLSGFNSRMGKSKLSASLDFILAHAGETPPPLLAMQSIRVPQNLPGLQDENILSLLPREVEPRIWIGGRAVVAAHYDTAENIACCVAGKRLFTLFPPDQIGNLYVGPLELTPAGATISMVELNNPDYEKYPRFKEAENAAQQAMLEPGDAIYIPYLWWHNVQALGDLNVLMNYWWGQPEEQRIDPRNALYHAITAVRFLPPHYRDSWKAMFDHYVFEVNGKPGEHLPEEKRGLLSNTKPESAIKKFRAALAKTLSRN